MSRINEILEKSFIEKYGNKADDRLVETFENDEKHLNRKVSKGLEKALNYANEIKEKALYVDLAPGYSSSFSAYLLGLTRVNPLPAHYFCEDCKKLEWVEEADSGFDLPEKECSCGKKFSRDGHSIDTNLFWEEFKSAREYKIVRAYPAPRVETETDLYSRALRKLGLDTGLRNDYLDIDWSKLDQVNFIFREDVYVYLLEKTQDNKLAFNISEKVRKGLDLKEEEIKYFDDNSLDEIDNILYQNSSFDILQRDLTNRAITEGDYFNNNISQLSYKDLDSFKNYILKLADEKYTGNTRVKARLDEELSRFDEENYKIFISFINLINKKKEEGFIFVIPSSPLIKTFALSSYLLGVSKVNTLPAHYYCKECKELIWEDAKDGFDLKDKECACGGVMKGYGHDYPISYGQNFLNQTYDYPDQIYIGECFLDPEIVFKNNFFAKCIRYSQENIYLEDLKVEDIEKVEVDSIYFLDDIYNRISQVEKRDSLRNTKLLTENRIMREYYKDLFTEGEMEKLESQIRWRTKTEVISHYIWLMKDFGY